MAYERTEAWRAFCERTGDGTPSTALFERVVHALAPTTVASDAEVPAVLADATMDAAIAARMRALRDQRFQELLYGLLQALPS